MLLLALLAQGLCLTGRSLPMRTAAAHARLRRSGAPALSDDGLMEALEVLDVAGGGETPDSFAALGMSLPRITDNLAAANITTPNSLQSAAFQPLARGRDAIVQAHTGSGKTLAFLLPLLEHLDARSNEPQALIVCPSRELAFQTARVADLLLEGTGLSSVALSGGANPNRQMERVRKTRPQLLVGTPGRVCELAFEWKKLRLQRVRHLVVDEVDEAFRQPYLQHTRQLLDNFKDGRPLQLIFASATSDAPAVRRAAAQLMDAPLMLRLTRGAPGGAAGDGAAQAEALPPTIVHGSMVLPQRKHMETLQKLARVDELKGLVFVNSPYRAKFVAQLLRDEYATPAAALYGEQEREERVDVMRKFLDGKLRLVVCTELGARGLDVPQLTHVINYELPTDERHYVHRAGRCGRAGAEGTVLNLVVPDKAFVVTKLARRLALDLQSMSLHAGKLVAVPAAPARRGAAAPRSGGGGGAAKRRGGKQMTVHRKKGRGLTNEAGGGGGDGGGGGAAAPAPGGGGGGGGGATAGKLTPAERAAAARAKAAAKRRKLKLG